MGRSTGSSNSKSPPPEPSLQEISDGKTHYNPILKRWETDAKHEIKESGQGGSTCPEQIGEGEVIRHRSLLDRLLGKNKKLAN